MTTLLHATPDIAMDAIDAVDAATVDAGGYDAVFAFECVHDLPDPVGVLAAMRRLAGERGAVVVAAGAQAPTANAATPTIIAAVFATLATQSLHAVIGGMTGWMMHTPSCVSWNAMTR